MVRKMNHFIYFIIGSLDDCTNLASNLYSGSEKKPDLLSR